MSLSSTFVKPVVGRRSGLRTGSRVSVTPQAATVVETAKAAGCGMAASAIKYSGLDLSSGNYTFFAPTDEAFKALPADVFESLHGNPELLAEVMSFHLCKGKTPGRFLENSPMMATLLTGEGGGRDTKLALGLRAGTQYMYTGSSDEKETAKGEICIGAPFQSTQGLPGPIEGGVITQTDLEADNGVVHVVDGVMIPKEPLPGDNGKTEQY
eukprot:CAMPEP_0170140980 /NCGR_PEP_ID=MMETSP0033_2-20121228/6711_1 /TAXON_ID=195969 /ORGANISM="Dolichomastix tenuilepis, Strain CCMP3274" /LENGTH=210 /DNA_ID=CAMNT_0010377219 /DNA_START=45 /DNA_END=677 /DNA_ORIENTATION=+